MRVVFADTSYYVGLLSKSDELHSQATQFASTYRGRVVTTAWILVELGNFLSPVSTRGSFTNVVDALKQSPYVSIIAPHPRYFEAGLTLYYRRGDKAWSLVDCISFLTMEQHGITEAITADHHFQQAGFKTLLR
jgi:predicted nucleic acid-binding protein